jgi:hypothetical protein
MALHNAVANGNAHRGREAIKAVRFLDEYNGHVNALKAAAMNAACSTTNPVRQGPCRSDL